MKKRKSNNKIKILNDNFMKELESIENIVKYVNDNEFKVLKDLSDTKENCESKKEINKNHKEEEYIEIFSNELYIVSIFLLTDSCILLYLHCNLQMDSRYFLTCFHFRLK